MEGTAIHRTGNALINEILLQYRNVSNESISGPNRLMNSGDKKRRRADSDSKQRDVASRESSKRIAYTLKMPPKEQNGLKFKETLIDGISLVCFSFGGEKRLCFNELLSKVLKDFSSQEISILRERLQVFCPQCTPHQMELFKIAGVLPWPCAMANLISKSDAFRLLGSLTSTRVPRRASRVFSADSLEVYHECFGGCTGMLEIELYHDPYTNCITCSQCDGVFSPRTFVTHNHSGESHTCHWGFDSSKWRLYLMLCNEHPTLKMQKLWEMLTNKSSSKRMDKQEPSSADLERDFTKKMRADETNLNETFNGKDKPVERPGNGPGITSRRSAFRPWSPLQHRLKSEGMERIEQQGSPRLPIPIPARLFAPHTIPPYMSSEFPCPTSSSAHYKSQLRSEITSPETRQAEETPANRRMGVISATPSTKDPHSLEKTAKEMVEVARSEKWEALSKPLSEHSSPRNAIKFLEGNIYNTLVNCVESGQLPSARSLSSLIAEGLSEVLVRQDSSISELSETKEKLKNEVDSLKENHVRNMEDAYDELKSTQKSLHLLKAKHREEEQGLNKIIFKLKQEAKALNEEKNELLSRNEKESVIALRQDVREISIKLKDKDSYCTELQNELRALHSWIDSQTRPVKHTAGALSKSESVIRTLYLVNGNATSKHQKNLSKENGVGQNSVESSEEESSQLAQF